MRLASELLRFRVIIHITTRASTSQLHFCRAPRTHLVLQQSNIKLKVREYQKSDNVCFDAAAKTNDFNVREAFFRNYISRYR